MKLRMRANSIRFRLGRSEVETLMMAGRIAETTHFLPIGDGLTYALESIAGLTSLQVRYDEACLTVQLPESTVREWAKTEQVGIYENQSLGMRGGLQIIVEKDFACLDLSDADNIDTFQNPNAGAVC